MKGIWGVIEFLEDDEYFGDICFDTRLTCKMILYVDIVHISIQKLPQRQTALWFQGQKDIALQPCMSIGIP